MCSIIVCCGLFFAGHEYMMGMYDTRCPQDIGKSQAHDDDNKHNHRAGSRAMVIGTGKNGIGKLGTWELWEPTGKQTRLRRAARAATHGADTWQRQRERDGFVLRA